ncbi:hypothetical protein D9M71_517440 [compost metagenome]
MASPPGSRSRSSRKYSTSTRTRLPPTLYTCCMCWNNRSSRSNSRPKYANATCATSKSTWPRATSSSSARKSRRPTWNPTANTGKTSSTVMCSMQTSGFRTRSTAIRKPAKSSTAWHSTKSWRKSKNRQASAIRRISVTKSSTSCCVPAPTITARIRHGSATRNCA